MVIHLLFNAMIIQFWLWILFKFLFCTKHFAAQPVGKLATNFKLKFKLTWILYFNTDNLLDIIGGPKKSVQWLLRA